jgi:hypothetical protein
MGRVSLKAQSHGKSNYCPLSWGYLKGNLMDKIPNSQLLDEDLPSRRATWKKIIPFAQSFNGYEHWGSVQKCREVAKQGVALHKSRRDLNQSLTDLRTCLFFEARRWKHLKKNPTKSGLEYVHALVEAIRVRVRAKELA